MLCQTSSFLPLVPIKALLLMLTYVLCVHAFITKCIVYPLFAHPFVPAWYNMLSNIYLDCPCQALSRSCHGLSVPQAHLRPAVLCRLTALQPCCDYTESRSCSCGLLKTLFKCDILCFLSFACCKLHNS